MLDSLWPLFAVVAVIGLLLAIATSLTSPRNGCWFLIVTMIIVVAVASISFGGLAFLDGRSLQSIFS